MAKNKRKSCCVYLQSSRPISTRYRFAKRCFPLYIVRHLYFATKVDGLRLSGGSGLVGGGAFRCSSLMALHPADQRHRPVTLSSISSRQHAVSLLDSPAAETTTPLSSQTTSRVQKKTCHVGFSPLAQKKTKKNSNDVERGATFVPLVYQAYILRSMYIIYLVYIYIYR